MNTEKTKDQVWKAASLALLTASLLFLVLVAVQAKSLFNGGSRAGIKANADSSIDTVTVEGTGDVTVKPDIATFSFGVTQNAKTVKDAQDAATAQMNAALKAVSAAGVADNDVKTTSYSINPHYEYQSGVCVAGGECRPGKSVLTGYDVSENVQVKVRDLSKAGDLFQTVGALGVENVDNLQFSVDKPEDAKDKARAIAIEDARSNADKLASELGVTLVRIVSFTDSPASPTPYPMMYSAMSTGAAAKEAPQVPAGDQKISDTVQVTYEIR